MCTDACAISVAGILCLAKSSRELISRRAQSSPRAHVVPSRTELVIFFPLFTSIESRVRWSRSIFSDKARQRRNRGAAELSRADSALAAAAASTQLRLTRKLFTRNDSTSTPRHRVRKHARACSDSLRGERPGRGREPRWNYSYLFSLFRHYSRRTVCGQTVKIDRVWPPESLPINNEFK